MAGQGTGIVPGDGNAIAFDIPAQPLEDALDAYGAASRMHVLYDSALTTGLRSTAVIASLSPEEALGRLLAGTNLTVRYTGPRSYTLMAMPHAELAAAAPPRTASPPPVPRQGVLDFRHFLGGVQAGITERLCDDALTALGHYTAALQFRISPDGAIEAPIVLQSSGNRDRDVAITAVLSRLSFSEAPPPDMPQPVTMVLAPLPSGACPKGAP